MRLILISDTHSLQNIMTHDVESFVDPTKTNILLHAGDLTNVGKLDDVTNFVYWIQNLKGFDSKIFIAGNHDMSFEEKPSWLSHFINDENLSQSDCHYLEDEEFVITLPEFSRPIKIYGSPWQPWFYDWAFNLPRNGPEIEEKWNKIPNDTDILITHGPPYGVRDFTVFNEKVGCEKLITRVKEIKPLVHVFGHIHHAYGTALINETAYVNASICNERYEPVNKPIVIELTEYDGTIIASHIE